ncbi:hypothetical protein BZL54_01300 [Burkholderia ubonensis subsp. mesacidophila]|uniref:Uncharacterized protein n=1 Tax=Burkholderia ubonensis subsp. mesacidophila TaxID=265293 RepID=A0A2A4FPE5_9BURK|nr:hypothetical protein BZL54_01300 [Burkholderia ubonensis subsp. mesacidophila]
MSCTVYRVFSPLVDTKHKQTKRARHGNAVWIGPIWFDATFGHPVSPLVSLEDAVALWPEFATSVLCRARPYTLQPIPINAAFLRCQRS